MLSLFKGTHSRNYNQLKLTRDFALLFLILLAVTSESFGQDCQTKTLKVGTASGTQGSTVEVIMSGEVDCQISGFIAAIGHDSSQVSFVDAQPSEFLTSHSNDQLFFQVTEHNEDGYVVIGAIFDISSPLTIPPTELTPETDLATLTYEILPSANLGTTSLLNRTNTYGQTILVNTIYSAPPGGTPIEPELIDGSIEVITLDPVPFMRGDVHQNGYIDIGDAMKILFFKYRGFPIQCEKAADVNDDGLIEVDDVLQLLHYRFLGGIEPAPPFRSCDLDPNDDNLSCGSYSVCEN